MGKAQPTKVMAHLSNTAGESIAPCDFNLTMPSEAERAAHAFQGSLLIAGWNSHAFKAEVIDNHLSDCCCFSWLACVCKGGLCSASRWNKTTDEPTNI